MKYVYCSLVDLFPIFYHVFLRKLIAVLDYTTFRYFSTLASSFFFEFDQLDP